MKQALLGPTLASTGIFNMRFLQDMVEQHQSGRRDYTAPIYTVMMFEAFLRNCLEEMPAPSGVRFVDGGAVEVLVGSNCRYRSTVEGGTMAVEPVHRPLRLGTC